MPCSGLFEVRSLSFRACQDFSPENCPIRSECIGLSSNAQGVWIELSDNVQCAIDFIYSFDVCLDCISPSTLKTPISNLGRVSFQKRVGWEPYGY